VFDGALGRLVKLSDKVLSEKEKKRVQTTTTARALKSERLELMNAHEKKVRSIQRSKSRSKELNALSAGIKQSAEEARTKLYNFKN
jgi:hypothetical protein